MLLPLFCILTCARPQRAPLPDVYQKAQLLEHQDDLTRALAIADQGLHRSLKEQETAYYWRFRLLKAEVLLVQGDSSAASKLVEGSIPKITGAGELRARQRMDQGRLQYSLGEVQNSLLSYDQAAQLARSAGLESLLAEIELRQGGSFLRLGKASAAEAGFLSGLGRARQQRDAFLEASAFADLAVLRMNDARYDEAIGRFRQALAFFEEIPSRRSIARTLNNLGYCELQLGNPEKALPLFKEANERATATGMWSDQQVTLGRIGDCYRGLGNLQNALAYYQQALGIAQRIHDPYWIANWLDALATTSIDLGDLQKAEGYNHQALALQQEMANPLEHLYPLLNAARLAASRRQFDNAEKQYLSIIASAQAQSGIRDPAITLEARSGLARMLVETGHFAEAETQWRLTLALINSTRSELISDEHRLTYLSSLISLYQDYVDFLAGRGRHAEAMLVAESSRARLLSERLRGSDQPPVPVSLSQFEGLARRSHTVFLSYWLAPKRSFLWVIGPTGLASFTLPGQAQIAQQVEAYRREIDDLGDPLVRDNSVGRELYDTLLAPARSSIPQGSKVAIAPDGALYSLNFETIPVSSPKPHYWIEDVTISVVPSMGMLMARRAPAKPQPPSLLLIGDPVSADPNLFPKLANAQAEIEKIQQAFPSSHKLVLTGDSAGPQAYAASHPEHFSLIHFAAHATANQQDPLDSAIILSPHEENYKLYARDVMRLPIHADLVTISACRSAGTRAYAGEGLVGFAWVFLRAGARHVVAGLWEVDDRSTALLMTKLYARLHRGSSPAEALR
ncbi:MAG: CHAT domain-containing protein, partial [Terriglobia bacterium]